MPRQHPGAGRYPLLEPDVSGSLPLYGLIPVPPPDGAGVVGAGSGVTDGLAGADADLPLFDAEADPPEAGV
jgi:hypothetical protein